VHTLVCSWYHRNRLLLVYTGNSLWAFPRWFPTTSSNRGTRAAHTDLSSAFRCPLRCCLSGSNRVRTMTCQEAPIEEHIAGQTEEQTEPRKTKRTRNNSHVSAPPTLLSIQPTHSTHSTHSTTYPFQTLAAFGCLSLFGPCAFVASVLSNHGTSAPGSG
jgi:hypothetical protein